MLARPSCLQWSRCVSAAANVSKRRPLSGVPYAWPPPDLTFVVRSASRTPARECCDTVVREHVAVEGVEGRVADVAAGHAFAQVIEDDDPGRRAEPGEGPFVEFGLEAGALVDGRRAVVHASYPSSRRCQGVH